MSSFTYINAVPDRYSRGVKFFFDDNVSNKELALLRRTIMRDVPCYAFDIFVINKNTTFDEDDYFATYLENVIVLPPSKLPLKTKRGDKGKRRANDDGNTTPTAAEFAIQIRGPKLATTSDILTTERSYGFSVVRDQPLFYVRENEEVDIVMYAVLSTGEDHGKFIVAELVKVDLDERSLLVETTAASTPQTVVDWALSHMPAQ